ncbi:MAG: SDR family NAD(P)-dependent oxidoreductase, partial [Pseudomonadales bacterium]
MDLELTGKKALVSAGHKGIGLFIARRLLEEGAQVSICCRVQEELDQAIESLSVIGPVIGQICDCSDVDQIKNWVKSSGASLGGIDICVGNASASGQHGEGPQPWQTSFEV